MEKFGEWLNRRIKESKKTKKGLAASLGHPERAALVTDIINGKRQVETGEAIIIAKYLGCPADEVIKAIAGEKISTGILGPDNFFLSSRSNAPALDEQVLKQVIEKVLKEVEKTGKNIGSSKIADLTSFFYKEAIIKKDALNEEAVGFAVRYLTKEEKGNK